MITQALRYLEAIKTAAPVAPFFASGASIVSHKLGRMTVTEYDTRLLDPPADISAISVGDVHAVGNLLSLHIELALRSAEKLHYVDLFEFDNARLISKLYLCRVSNHAFRPGKWLARI
ncbi:hypothetical protein EGJ54_24495 [Pandoraea apista]|nr:hypothetical protein [Pandoraea apista]RRW88825.1 hypothetical protein EGJ54_24495 [Pandoraea apista]RRW98084.1 hypothetical protein EGJ56_23905 [Pandoraea apista]